MTMIHLNAGQILRLWYLNAVKSYDYIKSGSKSYDYDTIKSGSKSYDYHTIKSESKSYVYDT